MFLNYSSVAFSDQLTKINGRWTFAIPSIYENLASGMKYPVLELAKMVRIANLPANGKTAFILAGGNAHFAGVLNKIHGETELDYDFRMPGVGLTQIFAHNEAKRYPDVYRITTDHSACASSLHVLQEADILLKHFNFNRVIVLAVEDQISTFSLDFFSQSGIHTSMTPSAFDGVNLGFNLGNGACTLVFEKNETANSIAEVLFTQSASEQISNSLAQSQYGYGYVTAFESIPAIFRKNITVVKCHGSGTLVGDTAEKTAIETMLKPNTFVATSLKPRIGHTLGTSGALEMLLLLSSIREHGIIPEIANRTIDDAVFLSSPKPYNGGNILALASGMGSIFTASVWRPIL